MTADPKRHTPRAWLFLSLYVAALYGLKHALPPDMMDMSYRCKILYKLFNTSRLGALFQYVPGVSILEKWDDFGFYYLVSVYAALAGRVFKSAVNFYAATANVQFLLFLLPIPPFLFLTRQWWPVLGLAAAMVAGFGLEVFRWSWNFYWAPGLCVVTAFFFCCASPGLLRLSVAKRLLFPLACGLCVGVAALVRQDGGFMARGLVAAAFALFGLGCLLRWKPARRETLKQYAVQACLFILASYAPALAMQGVLALHQSVTGVDHATASVGQHGAWHNMYLGLGVAHPNNVYGIRWNDLIGFTHGRLVDANVKLNTDGYLQSIKKLYLDLLLHDPDFVRTGLRDKYHALVKALPDHLPLAWLAATAGALGLGCFLDARFYGLALLSLLSAAIAAVPPLLTNPLPQYLVGVKAALVAGLAGMAALCAASFAGRRKTLPQDKAALVLARCHLLTLLCAAGLVLPAAWFGLDAASGRHQRQEPALTSLPALIAAMEASPIVTRGRVFAGENRLAPEAAREAAARFGLVTGGGCETDATACTDFDILNVTYVDNFFVVLLKPRRDIPSAIFLYKAYPYRLCDLFGTSTSFGTNTPYDYSVISADIRNLSAGACHVLFLEVDPDIREYRRLEIGLSIDGRAQLLDIRGHLRPIAARQLEDRTP